MNPLRATSYEITANNITNIDGKPLVDIRYIAKALGGSTTWSSLREDNRISAILALDFKSSDKQIILNTNTHKATVGSMGSSSVQDLPNLTFEAFTVLGETCCGMSFIVVSRRFQVPLRNDNK